MIPKKAVWYVAGEVGAVPATNVTTSVPLGAADTFEQGPKAFAWLQPTR